MKSDENEKKGIKKADKAFIGSDGRYHGDITEEALVELRTPRQIQKKQTPSKEQRTPEEIERRKDERYEKERKAKFEKVNSDLEHDEDIFDEEGNVIEDESSLKQKISQLKENIAAQISSILNLIKTKLEGPFLKIKSLGLKMFSKIFLEPVSKLFKITNMVFMKMFRLNPHEVIEKLPDNNNEDNSEKIMEEPVVEFVKASFNDVASINIIFTDNYDVPFYQKKKQGSFDFSKAEESIMITNAVEAIKQCSEFTKNVPPPVEGFYKSIPVSEVMENVSAEDISFFLGYVKARPKKYIGKSWKISETFATWLVNNAPMAQKN